MRKRRGPPASSSATPSTNDTAPPFKAVVVGLVPFFALLALVTFLARWHFDWLWPAISATGVVAVVALLWKWRPEGWTKNLTVNVAHLLTRRDVALGLWGITATVAVASVFVSSVHIKALDPPKPPIWLIRLEEPLNAPAQLRRVDSVLLERAKPHWDFVMRPAWGKRVSILSSTNLRTPDLRIGLWSAPVIAYPDRFQPVVTVTFLPLKKFLPLIAPDRPLRVVVTDDKSGVVIADTALRDSRRIPSLTLSVVKPLAPDSATQARWQRLLLPLALTAADTLRALTFTDWTSQPLWLPAMVDLGQRLRVVLTKASGEVVATDTVTLAKRSTDVLVRRRS
jgi:hypothetical protein